MRRRRRQELHNAQRQGQRRPSWPDGGDAAGVPSLAEQFLWGLRGLGSAGTPDAAAAASSPALVILRATQFKRSVSEVLADAGTDGDGDGDGDGDLLFFPDGVTRLDMDESAREVVPRRGVGSAGGRAPLLPLCPKARRASDPGYCPGESRAPYLAKTAANDGREPALDDVAAQTARQDRPEAERESTEFAVPGKVDSAGGVPPSVSEPVRGLARATGAAAAASGTCSASCDARDEDCVDKRRTPLFCSPPQVGFCHKTCSAQEASTEDAPALLPETVARGPRQGAPTEPFKFTTPGKFNPRHAPLFCSPPKAGFYLKPSSALDASTEGGRALPLQTSDIGPWRAALSKSNSAVSDASFANRPSLCQYQGQQLPRLPQLNLPSTPDDAFLNQPTPDSALTHQRLSRMRLPKLPELSDMVDYGVQSVTLQSQAPSALDTLLAEGVSSNFETLSGILLQGKTLHSRSAPEETSNGGHGSRPHPHEQILTLPDLGPPRSAASDEAAPAMPRGLLSTVEVGAVGKPPLGLNARHVEAIKTPC